MSNFSCQWLNFSGQTDSIFSFSVSLEILVLQEKKRLESIQRNKKTVESCWALNDQKISIEKKAIVFQVKVLLGYIPKYSEIFLNWRLEAERQTCHVALIVPHVMNYYF